MQASALRFELVPVEPHALQSFEDEWRALETRAEPEPFATFDWLSAWVSAYAPTRISVVRALEGGDPVGLGLIEHATGGRWYFAGRPASTYRGLLYDARRASAVWSGLASWVQTAPAGCAALSAEGLDADIAALLGRSDRQPTIFRVLALPDSFEAYLAQRSSSTRQTLRRKLRGFERAGGALVEAVDLPGALETFVRLHVERAASKGEQHAMIDERLTRLLGLLHGDSPRRRVWELELDGRTIAVTIHLELGDTVHFYNTGMDVSAERLSPGIVLELDLIRDAIERGLKRFDLGPGDASYKAQLGGEQVERYLVTLAAPTVRGRAVQLALAARMRFRARR